MTVQAIVNKLAQPSSWAGIAILANVAGQIWGLPPGVGDGVVQAATAICGLAAVFLNEKSGAAAPAPAPAKA